jgi:hypothetical protein
MMVTINKLKNTLTMKKLSIIIISLLMIGIFYACEEDRGPVARTVTDIRLDSIENYVSTMTKEMGDDVFTVLNWDSAGYNIDVVQKYRIEVDTVGNNFSNPAVISTTTSTNDTITVFDFNIALTNVLGMPPYTDCTVEIRVASVLGEDKDAQSVSKSQTLNVTTYKPPFEPDEIFVHGQDSILGSLLPVKDADGNIVSGQYEGYVYVPQGGNAIQFGDKAGETVFGDENQNGPDTDADLNDPITENGAAIPADSGYYQVTINTYDLTYDLYETAWGVIGSAIPPYDWSEDIDMTYHKDEDIWTVVVDADAAEFKFRPNDLWDPLNYGDDEGDGVPEEYGANIPISAGSKKITLDLSEYPYSYSVESAKK